MSNRDDDDDGLTPASIPPAIEELAIVLYPEDAPAPILSKAVRSAVHQWISELGFEEDLAFVGVKARRTALFEGPPGCGKTTLAHHIAGRLGQPLVLVDLSTMISMYVGGTGHNLGRFFRALDQVQGDVVVLFDEFDSMATDRASNNGTSASREQNTIVTQLLQRLDNYQGVLIAATNLVDKIDPAIFRRFSMSIRIAEPDEEARYAILAQYLRPLQVESDTIKQLALNCRGAMPELLKKLAEGIKRDLVLSPRFKLPIDVDAVLTRVITSASPHESLPLPPLWQPGGVARISKSIPWPPKVPPRPAASEKAA